MRPITTEIKSIFFRSDGDKKKRFTLSNIPEMKFRMYKTIGRTKFEMILPKLLKGSRRFNKKILPISKKNMVKESMEYRITEYGLSKK